MSTPAHVTEQSFDREVSNAELPVLVDFWAPWCGPCRMIAPIVDELAREYAGRVKVVKIDVDENVELARRFGILSIPTLAVFTGGQLTSRMVGYAPKAELKRHIETALNARASRVVAGLSS